MSPHPVLLVVTEIMLITIVTGFASSTSIIRISVLPFMVTCAWLTIPACKEHLHRGPWQAFVGGYAITFLFQYISTVLLSRWSFASDGPGTTTSSQSLKHDRYNRRKKIHELDDSDGTLRLRLKFGFLVATSFRLSGTPYEVKNVPRFSIQNPNYVPSRRLFLLQKAITILICYLVLDLLSLGADPETNKSNFSPDLIPLLTRPGNVSGKQLAMRLFATLGFGIGVYCTQQGCHSIAAFLDVGLGFSETKSWRPVFGSLGDAYTVRRFWRLAAAPVVPLLKANPLLQCVLASKQSAEAIRNCRFSSLPGFERIEKTHPNQVSEAFYYFFHFRPVACLHRCGSRNIMATVRCCPVFWHTSHRNCARRKRAASLSLYFSISSC